MQCESIDCSEQKSEKDRQRSKLLHQTERAQIDPEIKFYAKKTHTQTWKKKQAAA